MPRLAPTAALIVCLVTPVAAQQDVMTMRAEPLRPGLTVISGFANGNILVLSGPDGTLLVDAQSARRVGLADSVLVSLGAPPVRWVLNTHYHGDHVEGNALFRGRGAEVIGQDQLPVQMAKDTTITSWHAWHREPAAPGAFPTRTFKDSLTLRVNGQRVVVTHIPAAHTDGDAIVWLPDALILRNMFSVPTIDAAPLLLRAVPDVSPGPRLPRTKSDSPALASASLPPTCSSSSEVLMM